MLLHINRTDAQPSLGPFAPSLKVLYSYPGLSTEDQGNRGRGEMMGTSFVDYERRIREQFSEMFAPAGFDPGRDIAGIILNRWGHAYLNPQPGFFFGVKGRPAPREILRNAPFGPHRLRQHGSGGRHGSSLFDPRSPTRCRATTRPGLDIGVATDSGSQTGQPPRHIFFTLGKDGDPSFVCSG